MTILLKLLIAIAAAIASGILAFLAFPSFELIFLAYFALVPLLLSIDEKSAAYGFLLSHLCGSIFFLGIFNWILAVPKYTWLHHTILAIYLGSFVGVFGLTFSLIANRWSIMAALFAAPLLWVSIEYIRSNFFFLALPWGFLAHSQYKNSAFIQAASIFGAYGISFLIVMINSAIAAIIVLFFQRKGQSLSLNQPQRAPKAQIALITSAGLLLAITLIYGKSMLNRPFAGKDIKISVVQPNIPQERKWDPKYANDIMRIYQKLSDQALKHSPDLLIWPEAATPKAINNDRKIFNQVMEVARKSDAYLLLGSSYHQKFRRGLGERPKYHNAAFLIPPDFKGRKLQRYDKIRLFPFGEYLPMRDSLPWDYINVPDVSGYVPGKEYTLLEFNDTRFAATICWENIFPQIVRNFVKAGAQFVVNITNEAWFGKTAAPYQFLSMSVFRAVENRVYVVRCTNTGISCIIDPRGRILDRVRDSDGQDVFVRGIISGSIVPSNAKTFYTKHGDWLVWLSMALSIVFLLISFIKKLEVRKKY